VWFTRYASGRTDGQTERQTVSSQYFPPLPGRKINRNQLEKLTVRAVAVFSGPRDTSAGEVPDLVAVNTGNNGRVDVGSAHLAARGRRQIRTRYRYSNRHGK